jgi:predicted dehydrogenase
MHTVNIGVIGMGWMGQAHSRSYLQVPLRFPESGIKPRLLICSDNVQARADSARETLGFEIATTDWREVIHHPEVQVVNVCTPNDLHVEIIREAAAAGKHIFCEKPIGRSPQETAQVESFARNAGILCGVGYNYRWTPLVRHARNLVQSGELGEITHFRARFFSMYGSNPLGLLTWRFDRDIAGSGVLGDLLSHVVDMTHFMAGRIKRLVSQQHTFIPERPLPIPGKGTHYSMGGADDPKGAVTNEDYVGVLVEFENGARGTLEATRTMVGPKNQFAFELHGTKGALAWDFERMNELQVFKLDETLRFDGYTRLVGGDQYPNHGNFVPGEGNGVGYEDLKVIEAYAWLESVVANTPHSPSFAEALAVANVNAAVVRSWESAGWQDVTSIQIN